MLFKVSNKVGTDRRALFRCLIKSGSESLLTKQLPSNGDLEGRAQGNTEEKHTRDIFLCENTLKTKIKKVNYT